MNIRAATLADIPALQAMEQQCNPSPWSAAQLTGSINAPQPVWVIDLPEHGVVAMLVWQKLPDEAEIHLLNTHPAHRRQGYAQQLLEHLFQWAQLQHISRILLEVRASNCGALQLYEHNGFKRCGLRRNYYQNGDDAVLMEKLC
ncbi:ribosomal protein S18-alanine N-acetyltransferase [Snodgrassella sp. ESL0253]|uniref:ribosomal protein S18-alanine N-acetyltransferase n=1 Tax=Snodgrassella sp. ESL0253 TaxID=2705031 RepID=UPI0015816A91|nr:ribosomal protein S18-alanine N-acetyltransferase [Snodgrassella sp. ESL0253]NUE65860.1 ribosomal protein S18-alanine N-acetyltransferase [Snodgrassella sp. ESL0253]